MNFPELCRSCPSIAELKAAAVSVAQHEARPWFTAGLRIPPSLPLAIDAAAEAIGMRPAAIRETVLDWSTRHVPHRQAQRAKAEAAADCAGGQQRRKPTV